MVHFALSKERKYSVIKVVQTEIRLFECSIDLTA